MRRSACIVLETGILFAVAAACGGSFVLGALVAPVVFGMVPAPLSGDAMSRIFLRYDRVVIGLSCLGLIGELGLNRLQDAGRRGLLRGTVLVAFVALALVRGAWLSPTISRLHAQGAVRGIGEDGRSLEAMHRVAVWSGTAALLLGVVFIGLHVAGRSAASGKKRGPVAALYSEDNAEDDKEEKDL